MSTPARHKNFAPPIRSAIVAILAAALVSFGAVTAVGAATGRSTSTLPPFLYSVASVTRSEVRYSWRPGCPVPPSVLRLLHLSYYGFDHRSHVGTMVINATVVPSVVAVFRRLYAAGFPIHQMEPVDAYRGNDNASMAADNTSGFNCRLAVATGAPHWSVHAYGEAIDVNPVQNPYFSGGAVLPPSGAHYVDRVRRPTGDGLRRRDARRGVRGGRLVLGWPLDILAGLPAFLLDRRLRHTPPTRKRVPARCAGACGVALAISLTVAGGQLVAGASSKSAVVPRAACSRSAANDLRLSASVTQLVLVEAGSIASTGAELSLWLRRGRCFVQFAGPWPVWMGRSGLSRHRHEGDGTTPVGTYRFGTVVYGAAPDPGVHLGYHRLVCGDWWDEDPTSASYNRFVHVACGERPPFGGDSEALWTELPAYNYLAVVEFNTDPVVPGRGSGIFLHVSTGSPTDGCVSLGTSELLRVLRWLRPSADPTIAIGTAATLAKG